MENIENYFKKSMHGGWQAKSRIPLEIEVTDGLHGTKGQLYLTMTTQKRSNGSVTSSVNTSEIYERGGYAMETFVFGQSFGGTVMVHEMCRATEKAVQVAHSDAMRKFAGLVEQAKAWYSQQKEAA